MKVRGNSTLTVIPSASRLVTSLRDLGYDFVHAVADLVDNSIVANASRVQIDVRFDGAESWLRVADDGHGMSGTELTEAMRYGSQQSYGDDDLGKFGLGLKTASMSQCRRLTVASRTDPSRQRIESRQLDLDHVVRRDEWEVLVLGSGERDSRLAEPLSSGPGTVVLWEALDRVLGYKVPWGERAKSGLYALTEQLDHHLGMVFHRFASGEVKKRKKLQITLNGKRVDPWDPFARNEKATESLPSVEIPLHTADAAGLVRFQPYVLPPKARFSSEAAFNSLSGPAKWNAQQGFYVYRSNRMIQSGGWSWMRSADEHSKLARAALDFFPDLDSAFGVNVAKMRVTLPAQLREQLRDHVDRLARRAQMVYRQSGEETGQRGPSGRGGSHRGGQRGMGRGVHQNTGDPSPVSTRKALEAAAKSAGEDLALQRIIEELKKTNAEVARVIGW